MSTRGYHVRLPLKEANALVNKIRVQTDAYAVVKPERKLGAVYVDDHVALRRPVVMCEACWRKYSGWWRTQHYRPDWGWNYRSDCHGCGRKFVPCSLFVAEEKFFTVLDSCNHGLNPQP